MELPTSISAIVRRILVESGNKPVRVNALWDTVRALPDVQCTKTFFKRKIIGNMFVREELVKLRIADAREGLKKGASNQPGASSSSAPLVYAVRLKGSSKVHRTLRRQGVDVDLKTIGATGPPPAQQQLQ